MNNNQSIKNPLQTADMNDSLLLSVEKSFKNVFTKYSCEVKDFFSHSECSKNCTLLLAVSGGVDSQVMMHSVCTLSKKFQLSLSVVTVNHNIREEGESKADADLVDSYAASLGLACKTITIEPKFIENTATIRKKGIEEAARYIRYSEIKKHAVSIGAEYILFAHNKNDQLETLLQHFLQGAVAGISGFSASGIVQIGNYPLQEKNQNKTINLKIFRPLLAVTRLEIENYAKENNVPYRTDSTNLDTDYLRNKIRHFLVPVLNHNFEGWDTALLNGADKATKESHFVDGLADSSLWTLDEKKIRVKMPTALFLQQGFPVKIRLLYKGLALLNFDSRVAYKTIESIALGKKNVSFSGFEIVQKSSEIIIQKKIKKIVIPTIEIKKCGKYTTDFGTFIVKESVEKIDELADIDIGKNSIGNFALPIIIRPKIAGESILTAHGGHKLMKKIFSEWHIEENLRNAIPIIEYNNEPFCIWGAIFDYPNWYVKQNFTENDKTVTLQFIRNTE